MIDELKDLSLHVDRGMLDAGVSKGAADAPTARHFDVSSLTFSQELVFHPL